MTWQQRQLDSAHLTDDLKEDRLDRYVNAQAGAVPSKIRQAKITKVYSTGPSSTYLDTHEYDGIYLDDRTTFSRLKTNQGRDENIRYAGLAVGLYVNVETFEDTLDDGTQITKTVITTAEAEAHVLCACQ